MAGDTNYKRSTPGHFVPGSRISQRKIAKDEHEIDISFTCSTVY